MAANSKPIVESDGSQQNNPTRARQKQCGATTSKGRRCKAAPVDGSHRCARHGGRSGAPTGNQNARVHGFFAKNLSHEDLADLKEIAADLGSVDHEVMAARLRVRRVERAEQRAALLPNGLEIIKSHEREAKEFGPGDEIVRERVDYGAHSDRAIKTALHAVQVRENLIERRTERDAEKGDGPVTEFEVHIVTAENVHLYQGADADEVMVVDEPIPENPVL